MKHLLIFVILICNTAIGQSSVADRYSAALDTLQQIIDSPGQNSFKRAVFLTENVYLDGKFHKSDFNNQILILKTLVKGYLHANPRSGYRYADSNNINLNLGIYKVLKDTISITFADGNVIRTRPYEYDFNDFFGRKDWTKMFVTKLLATHSGNCHSLPFLYKILANELGASCWLALAPDHMYISNRCQSLGWYNTELTSGSFPIDAWIMASGYLPLKAVQSGIYMDTLSDRESIALCVLDLAKGYEHKTGNYYDGFILRCCDLSLKYFPLNAQAILLKAETLKRIYERHDKNVNVVTIYKEMETLYLKLLNLGYREMPDKMYLDWLQSVVKERGKYANKRAKETIEGGTNK